MGLSVDIDIRSLVNEPGKINGRQSGRAQEGT
jgi:hypothetical protein